MTHPPRPLIVRLRNWVGDVVLSLPLLRRLHAAGFRLELLGKPWAADLLEGEGWAVRPLPAKLGARVSLLREMRRDARSVDPGFDQRLNALALPYSFSCALEMRLAGLRALGHAYEGRSWLLSRSVPRHQGQHELLVYWQLGDALLGQPLAPPQAIALQPSPRQRQQAHELMRAKGLDDGFIVICPFAGGSFAGQDKTWPDFAAFAQSDLPRLHRRIVVCPGPGEEAVAKAQFAGATVLEGVRLGVYAALLERAALMISNDTGPGHLAAAVGTPLLSVLGPTDVAQWGAWGPGVQFLQGQDGWPQRELVQRAAAQLLRPSSR